MTIMKKSAWLATTALIGGLCLATGAQAQSTGSQAVEQIIVTAASGPPSTDGLAVGQVEPK
jgi:iron complex outermembrane receptor protein